MHKEALTDKGKQLLPYLRDFKSYYLAGGTALAIQIGHRVSVDFDFFSEEKIPKTLLPKIKSIMSGDTSIRAVVNNSDELTIFASETKITFLSYPFPLVRSLVTLEGLQMPTVQELAAMKAYTIGRRGEYKDYIDLYYLLSEKYTSLDEVLEIAELKYKNDFNDRLFLEQLIYLDDINVSEIKLLREKHMITKEQLKEFFESQIKKIVL